MADWGSTDQVDALAPPAEDTDWLRGRLRRLLSAAAEARSGGRSGGAGRAATLADPAALAAVLAALLGAVYLAGPLMGGDLSAQLARAEFASDHALTPVDLRWFGGTITFGYSLWTAPVMALIGPRVLSAIAAVVATWATTRLMQRGRARRPLLGGCAAAVCQASSMIEGRTTFDVGMACGLLCLLLLGKPDRYHRSAATVLALLASTASPMAALLLWLCAGALLLCRRVADSVLVFVAAGLPLLLTSLAFGQGGTQVFDRPLAVAAVAITALAFVSVPSRLQIVRLGAVLGIVMVAAAYLLPTPVGGNAMRLSLLFAIPVIVAFNELRAVGALVLVCLAYLIQSPVARVTLRYAGTASSEEAYYTPLLDEIDRRGPVTGRVEVPESYGHWEAAYVVRRVPLARGWLRQTDVKLNGATFYDSAPDARSFRRFLDASFVQYVAIPDAPARRTYGARERDLVRAGLPYLTEVWSNRDWRLYVVEQARPIVSAPGRLSSYTADAVELTAPPNTAVHLGVRWFPWLTIRAAHRGACIARDGANTVLWTGAEGGSFAVGSTLPAGGHHC